MKFRNYFVVASMLVHLAICAAQISEEDSEIQLPFLHHRVKRLSGPMSDASTEDLAKFCVSIRSRTPAKYFGDNHYCGGALITSRFVISVAHCFMDKAKILQEPRSVLVVAASPNRLRFHMGKTVNAPVKDIFVHPNFTRHNTNNIALALLEEPMPSANPLVGTIDLPSGPPTFGLSHTVLGWGRMYKRGPMSAELLKIDVELLPEKTCAGLLKSFKPEMLCAGNLNSSVDSSPCQGDKGAPMVRDGVIYGVVSYHLGCSNSTVPSVYTNVWYHVDWINEMIENRASGINGCIWLWFCGVLATWIYL